MSSFLPAASRVYINRTLHGLLVAAFSTWLAQEERASGQPKRLTLLRHDSKATDDSIAEVNAAMGVKRSAVITFLWLTARS